MMKIHQTLQTAFAAALLWVGAVTAWAADRFVFFQSQPDGLCLTDLRGEIESDPADWKGVHLAVANLKTDLQKVTGRTDFPIVVGTLGRSKAIDKLARKGVFDAKQLKGKCEKFIITATKGQLVIAGSDKRGTIYGIYELCAQIGVSPWYDWADVPVERHDNLYIAKGQYTDGEPAVRYRGIFLNDEAPCLSGWVGENYGGVYNHEFYARVFELVLRLKGNFMWPAMWNSSFYADDPLNMQTADDMGVMMGTSHHEPMARAHKEWTSDRSHGAWNYDTNQATLERFWQTGVERMRETEDVVTIGMRGDGDEPMGDHADVALLERIVNSQRQLIEKATGRPAEETPQVWALYKEVQEYYEKGMRVPDDVILLLCDDNWGNVRILPEGFTHQAISDSRMADNGGRVDPRPVHPGGYGIYYHVDYVGGPRNTKFLNVSQVQRMWEQLQLTYTYGVDQLWILNVGDLKPMELPIDFWFKMAWNPAQFNASNLQAYQRAFCAQQLGEKHADEAARILNLQCKYAHRRTPELLDARSFNLANGEWKQRVDEYNRLERDANILRERIGEAYRNTYDQLIYFPVRALANLYNMYYAQALNRHYAALQDPLANRWANRVELCFKRAAELCDDYNHRMSNGKWNHMMDEIYIGYRSWNNPPRNIMPEVRRVEGAEVETDLYSDEIPAPAFAPDSTLIAVMEAADHAALRNPDTGKSTWQVIPDLGPFRDAIALLPYTEATDGAEISYDFTLAQPLATAPKAVVAFAPTFPFNGGRGQRVMVLLDGKEVATININEASRYIIHGYHDQNYEWETTRTNRQTVTLTPLQAGTHRLALRPLDPGVAIEQVRITR